jgi:hypothetical protein
MMREAITLALLIVGVSALYKCCVTPRPGLKCGPS